MTVAVQTHAALLQAYLLLRPLRFQKQTDDFNCCVITNVDVPKLTAVWEREYIIEGFRDVRMKYKTRGHLIKLTKTSPDDES
jgi:hypothetical protein